MGIRGGAAAAAALDEMIVWGKSPEKVLPLIYVSKPWQSQQQNKPLKHSGKIGQAEKRA